MKNVTETQQFLAAQTPPFDVGPIDGVLGQRTVDAINAYLIEHDSPPIRPPYTLVQINNALWPQAKETQMADSTVTVGTQNPLASTSNWALLISIISTIAPFIGLHLPVGFGDIILQAVSAATALYALVRKVFFTSTVSTLVAKNL